MHATARAHTNIALIKYWGKRDESLFLPTNSSLSITLDEFYTTTTVSFQPSLNKDVFLLNGEKANEHETNKISRFLDKIRIRANKQIYAEVNSLNQVPTAAGFASSASGFAALAAAATKAIGLEVTNQELSIIARQGSGSACRSIYGGFVEWQQGVLDDGTDSHAVPILHENEWNVSILSVLLESEQKKVLSRDGMKRTVETSVFYSGWLEAVQKDLTTAKQSIAERNFEALGKVAEANALKMHATTLGAEPPFMYWQSSTLDVMQKIQELREAGMQAYFTIDAGPNVKVLCQPKDEEAVRQALLDLEKVKGVHTCHPGPGIVYLD